LQSLRYLIAQWRTIGWKLRSQNYRNGPNGLANSNFTFYVCANQTACTANVYMARADGSLRSLLVRLARIDLLVIDDWATAPLSEPERRDFWEICEDRYQVRSTILTSQLPVLRWREQIGEFTRADGILDRLPLRLTPALAEPKGGEQARTSRLRRFALHTQSDRFYGILVDMQLILTVVAALLADSAHSASQFQIRLEEFHEKVFYRSCFRWDCGFADYGCTQAD
jgi:hypothetical protein